MKLVILLTVVVGVAAAAPQYQDVAGLRFQEFQLNLDGSYKHKFEIDDGTRVIERGEQREVSAGDSGTVSDGQYTFVADGQRFTVDWVADENGYRATGDHLPTPPPMPQHVRQMLEQLRLAGRLS